MFSESRKVFVACAVGAGIGSFVALEISAMFCWIGFLVGGLVGYLSYEWRKVLRAIPRAWYTAQQTAKKLHFPPYYIRTVKWFALCLATMLSWFIVVALLTGAIAYFEENAELLSFSVLLMCCAPASLLVVTGMFAFASLGKFCKSPEEENAEEYEDIIATNKVVMRYFSPPVVLFWYMPRGLVFCFRRSPAFMKWFVAGCILVAREWGAFWARFFWNLFLLVHSEMRILCGIDAVLGAGIGYFAGSAVIGALVGGLVGVFNYLVVTELCLKRIWCVIPIKS